jgi:uncharacterized SAM-binding protein YcdF (DUF218 family)
VSAPGAVRWGRRAVALAAAVLLAVALRHAGTALIVAEEIATPDAIVSLASHEWERLPAAAALARRAPEARVLLTVPMAVNAYNCHGCADRIGRLEAAGVARDRIEVLRRAVYRTTDEAEAFREWAGLHRPRSVVVVTSPYHTRRALASFRKALAGTGIAVGIHPAESVVDPPRWYWYKFDRWYVIYEWRARVFYLIRFGVW